MPNSALPDWWKGKRHNDWPWPFSWIPRAWTSFKLFQPPIVIFGYKTYDWTFAYNGEKKVVKYKKWIFFKRYKVYQLKKDFKYELEKIGPNPCQRWSGAFTFSFPWHISWTIFDTGWYIRVGFRWDDVDMYYTFPAIRIKNFGINQLRDK